MKLDILCVRRVLQTVEKYETIYEPVSFDDSNREYYDDFLSSYPIDKILYHVQYCIKAELLSDVCSDRAWGQSKFECCLEPNGHDFLSNINTEEKWSEMCEILSKIGGASLKVTAAIAEGVTTALANKYLPDSISNIIP